MKLLIVLAICIVVVIGDDEKPVDKVDEELKEYRKQCILELKLDSRLINGDENATIPSPQEAACYQACLDIKLGLMNEDGSYNLIRMNEYAKTLEELTEIEKIFNEKIKTCQAEIGNDKCKMAACTHSMPKELWTKKE